MQIYALIGKKLGHSFSADFFNAKFSREGVSAIYQLLPIPEISILPDIIASYPALRGLNVTIPYKRDILHYLDFIDPVAQAVGAVNTVAVVRNSDTGRCGVPGVTLYGYNTDVTGFHDSLIQMLASQESLHGATAIILGTGGASRAVEYVLRHLGANTLLVSRNSDCTPMRESEVITYDALSEQRVAEAKVIVNCTPLGMYPDTTSHPPIPYHAISPATICYDLVYNPEVTTFMRLCEEHGASVCNGLQMLHGQALAAWRIWTSIS